MREFIFSAELWLPRPPEVVFAFFAEARNLDVLTPPWVRLEVLTLEPIVMRAGTIIDYRIRVHGLPLRWRTEIVEWNPPHSFVDVQRRGPYKLWHHTHTFLHQDNGTTCADRVRYYPRGGALMNRLFVRRDVERIFAFRRDRLLELFGSGAMSPSTIKQGRC
jgi:ligand-binding SRPBCC domain-containing protein